jgi:hypothetical protein
MHQQHHRASGATGREYSVMLASSNGHCSICQSGLHARRRLIHLGGSGVPNSRKAARTASAGHSCCEAPAPSGKSASWGWRCRRPKWPAGMCVSWRRSLSTQYQIQSSLLRGKLRSETRTALTARTPRNTPKPMIRINMISSFLRTIVRN